MLASCATPCRAVQICCCIAAVCLTRGAVPVGAAQAGQPAVFEGPSIAELLAWANDAGINTSPLAADDSLGVRGVIAKQDIKPGTAVVKMTRAMSLAVVDGQKSPFPDLVPEHIWEECSQDVQLGLRLLQEVKAGPQSKWDLWIQTLPKSFDTLIHWSSAQLEELQTGTMPGEQLTTRVQQQWDKLTQDIESLKETPLVQNLNISADEIVWAANVVTSRTFAGLKKLGVFSPLSLGSVALFATLVFRSPIFKSWKHSAQAAYPFRLGFMVCMSAAWLQNSWSREGSSEISLLPIMDLINHRSTSQGEVKAGRFSNGMQCVLHDSFRAGEEVFHSYGDKNNEVLLQYYGFVEDINVNDYYTADLLQFVKAHGNVTAERLEEWEASPYLLTLQQAQLHRDGWAGSTTESLRSLLASQSAWEQAQALNPYEWMKALVQYREVPHAMTTFKQAGSVATEQAVFQILQDFCSEAVASKPTTLEADIKQLKLLQADPAAQERLKMALQFRISIKQLLHTCLWQYDPSQAGVEA